ncbi:MAG TPA: hypothetical protein VF796_02435, partial [Humisphaera sp.]
SMTGGAASFAGGLVTVSAVDGNLTVAPGGTISGKLSGQVAAGNPGGPFAFAGAIEVSVAAGAITAATPAGQTNTLSVGGQTVTGALRFFKDAGGFEVGVNGVNFSLPGGALGVENASGTLSVAADGIRGTASGTINAAAIGLSGGLGIRFAPGLIEIVGSNTKLDVGGQSISGDFSFSRDSVNNTTALSIANATTSLGGGLVTVTGASANLTVAADGSVSGGFDGVVSAGSGLSGVSFNGPMHVAVTPTSIAAGTPAGQTATLTVAGQTITAGLQFVKDSTGLKVDVSGVSFSIANGVVAVNNGGGSLRIGPGGVSGAITATVSSSLGTFGGTLSVAFAPGSFKITGTNNFVDIGGQRLSGDFAFSTVTGGATTLAVTNASASLGGGLVSVTGASANLSVGAGGFTGSFAGTVSAGVGLGGGVNFSGALLVNVAPGSISAGTPAGQKATLTVGSQSFSAGLQFSKDATGLKLGVTDLSLSLGGGAVTVSQAGGSLVVAPTGVSGSLQGTVQTNVANVQFDGTFGLAFAPGSVQVSAANASLVAYGQSLGGNFAFSQQGTTTKLAISNLTGDFGNGVVGLTDGTADFTIAPTGVTGSASGTITSKIAGVTFGGTFGIVLAPGSFTVRGTNVSLGIGSQSVSGDLSLAFNSVAGTSTITASNLNLSLGGFVTVANAGGTIVLTRGGGVSGSASGTVQTNIPNVQFGGSLAIAFSPTALAVSGTNCSLTVLGQTLTGDFAFSKSGTTINLSVAKLGTSIGGVVTVANGQANLVVDAAGVTGTASAQVSVAAPGVTFGGTFGVAISPTGIAVSGNNASLTIGSQTLTGNFAFSKSTAGVKLAVSGLGLSLGGVIAVSNGAGEFTVTSGPGGGVSGSASGTVALNVPGVTFGGSFAVAVSPAGIAVSGTGVTVAVGGQTIGGDFAFTKTPTAVSLKIDNLNLALGGVLEVTNGSGNFTVTGGTGGGLTGTATGTIKAAVPNVTFGGTYSVTVAPGAVTVTGTNATLGIFGQTISGNFTFSKTPTATNLRVDNLALSLGNGLVAVTGGTANFTLAGGQITGTASGNVSAGAGLPVSFSGLVSVAVATTGITVAGTGLRLTIAGQTLTGDLKFSRNNSSGAIAIGVANMAFASGGASVTASGNLLIAPTGLSGSLTASAGGGSTSATVTVTFSGGTYSVSAGISTSIDLGGLQLTGSFAFGSDKTVTISNLGLSLGGGIVTLTGGTAQFAIGADNKLTGVASGTISVSGINGVSVSGQVALKLTSGVTEITGINDSITVFGQTLSGSFRITDNKTLGTVQIHVDDLNVSLADTVSLRDGTVDVTLGRTGAIIGGSAAVAFTMPDVTFGASRFGINLDTTGGAQDLVITAGGVTLAAGGQTLAGDFAFRRTRTAAGAATVAIVAQNVRAELGDGTTGVRIDGGYGAILMLPTGMAMSVGGQASLFGVTGLTLGGSLDVRFNNTGKAVNETVAVPDPTDPTKTVNKVLKFGKDEQRVAGTATLSVQDSSGQQFVDLTGGFSVTKVTAAPVAGVQQTKVQIAAAGLDVFLGSGPARNADGSINPAAAGVLVEGASLGIALYSRANVSNPASPVKVGATTYALAAGGAGRLLGVPGLTLGGTLALQVNNTGGAVHEVLSVPDPADPAKTIAVALDQTGNAPLAVAGTVDLAVADPSDPTKQFAKLSGGFSFTKNVTTAGGNRTTEIVVGASGMKAFIGAGDTGLQVHDGKLGLVMTKTVPVANPAAGAPATFGFEASGNVSLVGLPGLNVDGSLAVRFNNGAGQLTRDISVPRPADPATTDTVHLDLAPGVRQADGSLSFAILDSQNRPVVSISGDVAVTQSAGLTRVVATPVTFALAVDGSKVLSVSGKVAFTIGGTASSLPGFNLDNANTALTSFTLLDSIEVAIPPTLPLPAPAVGGALALGAPLAPAPAATPVNLGPLKLVGLKPAISGFSFKNNTLSALVGLRADSATLNFGGATAGSGVTSTLTGVQGQFELAVGVDLSSFKVTSFGPTGRFSLSIASFNLAVNNVLTASATGVVAQYNPKAD